MASMQPLRRPRVVVVGVGFGGLAAAKALADTPAEVILVDRRNYHLFQPLLYQVATAGLSPADIAWPIRAIVARQGNTSVQLGRVTGVDTARRTVLVDGRPLAYDHLVLATGARHSYFGRDEWEDVAPGLKKIADATHIRERIEARTVIWGAGVIASPAARWLGTEADRAGRVVVAPDLSVPGMPDVFVIGDTAAVLQDGLPVPGIAPAAKQMGTYVGRLLDARIRGHRLDRPFRYRHRGNLATIGRKAAVAELGPLHLSGFPAWLLWAAAHVWFLIGWRNRLVVGLHWLWNYLTFERGARLITAPAEEGQLPSPPTTSAAVGGTVRVVAA